MRVFLDKSNILDDFEPLILRKNFMLKVKQELNVKIYHQLAVCKNFPNLH